MRKGKVRGKVWHRRWKGGKHRDWIADIRDRSGKRHRFSAKTREEAETLLTEKIEEYSQPEKLVVDSELTLGEYAERCLKGMALERRLKPRTIASYRQNYYLHIKPTLGASRLCDLTLLDVKELLNAKREQTVRKQERTLSKNSIRLIRATLSVLFEEAVEDGLIKTNPVSQMKHRRGSTVASQEVLRPFEQDEVDALLKAAREIDLEYFPLFLTFLQSGLRPGEVYGLEWDDIDFSEHKSEPMPRIHVARALSAGKIGLPKTASSVRDVDMSQELVDELKSLYKTREAQTLKRGWGEVPEPIFITSERGYLDESRVRKRFKRVLKKAGITGHTVYDCRHTFASLLLAAGAPITYVAAQLGHEDPAITLKYYSRWLPNSGKSFVDLLNSRPNADSIPAQLGTKLAPNQNRASLKEPQTDEKAA